jgi:hypothetical protein
MEKQIEFTLQKLRAEAEERGISFHDFAASLLGAAAVMIHRAQLGKRLADAAAQQGEEQAA